MGFWLNLLVNRHPACMTAAATLTCCAGISRYAEQVRSALLDKASREGEMEPCTDVCWRGLWLPGKLLNLQQLHASYPEATC